MTPDPVSNYIQEGITRAMHAGYKPPKRARSSFPWYLGAFGWASAVSSIPFNPDPYLVRYSWACAVWRPWLAPV